MKKTIFSLILLFIFFSCKENETIDLVLPNPDPIDTVEIPKDTVKPFVIDKKSLEYALLIDSIKLKEIITILASDEFEGRTPDSLSVHKTENYLANYLENINVQKGNGDTTYYQKTHYTHANLTNVVGLIEGNDLKDEYILLCAHFDHLGINEKEEVYYGADDNASGVSALLEIIEKMMIAKQKGVGPKRSVILLFTTGEETGFIGAREYTIFNPLYPINKTKACLNVDMVGRIDPDYSDKSNNYTYIAHEFQSSNSMDLIAQTRNVNNQSLKMELDTLSYNYLFRRTDARIFAGEEIPTISFTSGLHNDYHTPNDKVDYIDFDG